jgi:hypothetical protein
LEDSQVTIRKSPAMANTKLTEQTIAFIQVWSAMVDWEQYRAFIIIDIDSVYFLLYDLRTEALEKCYLGIYLEGNWYIEKDRAKTWSKINSVLNVIKIEDMTQLGGEDDELSGDNGTKTVD